MVSLRPLVVVLALALCGVEGVLVAGSGGPGVVVAPVDTRVALAAPAVDPALEPDFLAHMTADDVARGVYALAAVDGADPASVALTPPQRAAIGPLLQEGAALRAQLGELRMARRAAREAWLADGAGLVAALGPERLPTGRGASTGVAPPMPTGPGAPNPGAPPHPGAPPPGAPPPGPRNAGPR